MVMGISWSRDPQGFQQSKAAVDVIVAALAAAGDTAAAEAVATAPAAVL